jgi:hypothetical protein
MNDKTLRLIALANELEAFIQEYVPESSSLSKYGGTLFTLKPNEKEGQFCGVFLFSQHAQISFSKGSQLNDPQQQLKGSGKNRRHINFKQIDEIDFSYLKELIAQSSKL